MTRINRKGSCMELYLKPSNYCSQRILAHTPARLSEGGTGIPSILVQFSVEGNKVGPLDT